MRQGRIPWAWPASGSSTVNAGCSSQMITRSPARHPSFTHKGARVDGSIHVNMRAQTPPYARHTCVHKGKSSDHASRATADDDRCYCCPRTILVLVLFAPRVARVGCSSIVALSRNQPDRISVQRAEGRAADDLCRAGPAGRNSTWEMAMALSWNLARFAFLPPWLDIASTPPGFTTPASLLVSFSPHHPQSALLHLQIKRSNGPVTNFDTPTASELWYSSNIF